MTEYTHERAPRVGVFQRGDGDLTLIAGSGDNMTCHSFPRHDMLVMASVLEEAARHLRRRHMPRIVDCLWDVRHPDGRHVQVEASSEAHAREIATQFIGYRTAVLDVQRATEDRRAPIETDGPAARALARRLR